VDKVHIPSDYERYLCLYWQMRVRTHALTHALLRNLIGVQRNVRRSRRESSASFTLIWMVLRTNGAQTLAQNIDIVLAVTGCTWTSRVVRLATYFRTHYIHSLFFLATVLSIIQNCLQQPYFLLPYLSFIGSRLAIIRICMILRVNLIWCTWFSIYICLIEIISVTHIV
jgi:hypothetical protein